MKLIVGLGNPDRRYRHTRHNVGWDVIDRLAHRHGIAVNHEDGWSLVGAGTIRRHRAVLAKPQTYVNLSGTAVADLRRRHRVKLEDLLVVVDDLDLPLGRLRLRPGGTHGGHNGLRSVIDALGSSAFPRLRVGIGQPPVGVDPAEFVLTTFTDTERASIEPALERAAEAIETVIGEGLQAAMNRFNAKPAEASLPMTPPRTSV
jgi:PTH1 family peptidyl-tRNA hydrolase